MTNSLDEENKRLEQMFLIEKHLKQKGYHYIAGIDEAGRGPLAGPVVACACILPDSFRIPYVDDSKKIDEKLRIELYHKIIDYPGVIFGTGIVGAEDIDLINILQATFLAMERAVEKLAVPADYLIIDGKQLPKTKIPALGVVKGDSLSLSIATASIIAKCIRDELMQQYHVKYPEYGFDTHKGYGTKKHIKALQEHGVCAIHRKSFEPVKLALINKSETMGV